MKILEDRIDLGEAASALSAHDSIKQSCMVLHVEESGLERLIAYYVSSDSGVTATELRTFLTGKLPQNLIPVLFVPMNSFPLTPNGEVDKAALPKPSLEVRSNPTTEPATTALENIIIAVWREFLGIERIEPNDNFFDLGGDSLLLVRVHTKLQEALQIKFSIMELFEYSTVGSLAHCLSGRISHGSTFSEARQRAQKQRAAFARQRERRLGRVT